MAFYGKVEALRGAKPWFVMSAITQLEDELVRPDWHAFEWGSGGSTLWLSQWCAHVVSVEHNPDWHLQTWNDLEKWHIDNVNLVRADLGGPYESFINHYPPGSFDLIFIDGRNRAVCLAYAIPGLVRSGILVLDNSEREQYQAAITAHLANWQRWDHLSGNSEGWTTTIWRKP